jgi:hypothetical protein
LTIDILDNLYFYYNVSSRSSSHSNNNSLIENFTTSIDLLNENSTTSIDLLNENFTTSANLSNENFTTSANLSNENFTISANLSNENFTTSANLSNENFTTSVDMISVDMTTVDMTLSNENLSLTSPPPAYSSSYISLPSSTLNLSDITHNTPETGQSTIDHQSVTNDDRLFIFPSFLSNIPPPPPPPTYQETLEGDSVLFVEGRGQFGNEQVYFGMGRRGSVIRGWL